MRERVFVLFVLGLLLASGGAVWKLWTVKAPVAPRPPWSPPRLPIEQVRAPVPARFSAPLPTRVEDFWAEVEKGPPLSHVQFRLMQGDREMGERFLVALRQAAASAESLVALQGTYGEALWPEEDWPIEEGSRGVSSIELGEPPCDWLSENLEAPGREPPLIRALFWSKLAMCSGSRVEALFARDDAPLLSVLEQYHRYGPPRLTLAMQRAVRRLLSEDRQELFDNAAAFLSRSTEPVARELLEELARSARGEAAEEVQESRKARSQEEEYNQRQCRFLPTTETMVATDAKRLDQCVTRWAHADWTATARLASLLGDDPRLSPSLQEAFAVLTRFPSIEARDAWAREKGLLPTESPVPSSELPPVPLLGRMYQVRRALYFFASRGKRPTAPVRHDVLLVALAWSVRPALQDVVFEELAPPEDASLGELVGDYTLRAYADGERFSLTARNLGDYWDMGAVLALLNQVLEARGSPIRFAAEDKPNSVFALLFGPEAALREAHALGMLHLGDARDVILRVREEDRQSVRRLLGLPP
ncbi:hypothetical protein [Hyalangium versicolor]|uniref:hypothetical protein n=1 Tax=Hyalangium versicolor TaxID=2861190 RepID=UPI001CCF52A3|nr:hypothetical protein [Hyalangium versicolor]